MLFVQLTLGLNAFITAQGFAKIGMRTVLIGAVANIVLDPIFIYGLHMGVRGAALATILSQGLSCIWVLRFLTGPKTLLRLKKENVRFRPALILPCVAPVSYTHLDVYKRQPEGMAIGGAAHRSFRRVTEAAALPRLAILRKG